MVKAVNIWWVEVKENLIHKLGGYTEKEYKDNGRYGFNLAARTNTAALARNAIDVYFKGYNEGCFNTKKVLQQLVDSIAGCDKQTWIDTVYNAIYSKPKRQKE